MRLQVLALDYCIQCKIFETNLGDSLPYIDESVTMAKKKKQSLLEKQFLELANQEQIELFEKHLEKIPFQLQHYVKDINTSFDIIDTDTRIGIYLKAEALDFCCEHFENEAKRERLNYALPTTAVNDIRDAKTAIKNSIKSFTKLRHYAKEVEQLELMKETIDELDKNKRTMTEYYQEIKTITINTLLDAGFKKYRIIDEILPTLSDIYKDKY